MDSPFRVYRTRIYYLISLPQLTRASFTERETTGDESAAISGESGNTQQGPTQGPASRKTRFND